MSDGTGAGGTLRDDELIMAVIEAAKAQRRALRARPPIGSSDHDAGEWSRYVREAVDAYEAALDNLEAEEGEASDD